MFYDPVVEILWFVYRHAYLNDNSRKEATIVDSLYKQDGFFSSFNTCFAFLHDIYAMIKYGKFLILL